jgi:hypothetical protein
MSAQVRRAGQFADDAGRTVTWSVADGARGRRWRWTVVDRRGTLLAAHTLETDPDGRFLRLESATAPGLLSLHREPDGSVHGNRIGERGIDHLTIEAPAPEGVLIGGTALSVSILLGAIEPPVTKATLDVLEIFDDLGLRIVSATVRPDGDGGWEIRTNRLSRRAVLDADGLPAAPEHDGLTWPLERA